MNIHNGCLKTTNAWLHTALPISADMHSAGRWAKAVGTQPNILSST